MKPTAYMYTCGNLGQVALLWPGQPAPTGPGWIDVKAEPLVRLSDVEALMRDGERFRHLMFNHVDWERNGTEDDSVVLTFGPYPSHTLRDTIDAEMTAQRVTL